EKIGREGVERELLRITGDEDLTSILMELVDAEGGDVEDVREIVSGVRASEEALERLGSLLDIGRELGLPVRFAPSLARGLVYYTGMVFEAYSEVTSLALGGGGRYDGLISLYGGPRTPATGMSLGLDRIIEVVSEVRPPEKRRRGVFVARAPGVDVVEVLRIARGLRALGVATDLDLRGRSLARQLEYADKGGFRYAVIVGPRELAAGRVRLKDLTTGVEREVGLRELGEALAEGK
ncbi:MAG: histidine--tRNA ligase, partial [Thermoproteota archaeon]